MTQISKTTLTSKANLVRYFLFFSILATAAMTASVASVMANSTPVVELSVDGGSATTVAANDQTITLEWLVENATNCNIMLEGGGIVHSLAADEYPIGSLVVTPPADSESNYTLRCQGTTSSVGVGVEPNVILNLTPEDIPFNSVTRLPRDYATMSWSSTNADYCYNFSITRESDGQTRSFDDGDAFSQTTGELRLFFVHYSAEFGTGGYGYYDWLYSNDPSIPYFPQNFAANSVYTVSITCRNQSTGAEVTQTAQFQMTATELPEIEMYFLSNYPVNIVDGTMLQTRSAETCLSNNNPGCECYDDICSYEYEPLPGRDYVRTSGPSTRDRFASCSWPEGSRQRTFTGPFMVTDTRECRQEVGGEVVNVKTQVLERQWSGLASDVTLESLTNDFPVTATLRVRDLSYNEITSVVAHPITGEADIYVNVSTEFADMCERVTEIRPDGTESVFGRTDGWSTRQNYPRTLNQVGVYTYTVDCYRYMASLAAEGEELGRLYAETAVVTFEVLPSADVLPPSANIDSIQLLTDPSNDVSTYRISWSSENTSECAFSGTDPNGNPIVLSNLQPTSVNAVSGSREQSFPSNGQTININLECFGANNQSATDTAQINVPGTITDGETGEEVVAEAIITTGQCLLGGVVINLGTHTAGGYYREDTSTIEECRRFAPNVIISQVATDDLSTFSDPDPAWTFDFDALVYNNVEIIAEVINNDPNAFVHSFDGDVSYEIAICYNSNQPTCEPDQIVTGQLPGNFTPLSMATISEFFSGVPLGDHLLTVRVDRMQQVAGLPRVWDERQLVFPVRLPEVQLSLTLDNPIMRQQSVSTVTGSVDTLYPVSCAIVGPGIRQTDGTFPSFTINDVSSTVMPFEFSASITGISSGLVTLTCTELITGTDQEFSVSQRVEIIPNLLEI